MRVEQSTNTTLQGVKANEQQVLEPIEEKQDFSKVLDDEVQTLGTSGGGVKRPPN